MCFDGVGVDAEEDVAEYVGLSDIELLEFLHVVDELLVLLFGISVTVVLLCVTQIVGNVVVGSELIGSIDTLVEECGDESVVLVAGGLVVAGEVELGDLGTEGEVNASLRLGDTCKDTVQVFAGFLDIAAEA